METCVIPPYFSTRHFAMLGRLVAKNKPDVTNDLIKTYFSPAEPIVTDYRLMADFFSSFILLVEPEETKLDQKRLYIAVMLRLYKPRVISDKFQMQAGFVKNLAITLDISRANISRMIRQVSMWESVYDDFEKKVSCMADKMIIERRAA